MSVADRLKEYISYKKTTNAEFERTIGASNGYINSIRRSIGVDKLEQIEHNFPELNTQWLLKGEGEMLKQPENEPNPFLITKTGTKYFEMPNGTFLMSVPFVPIKAYAKYVDECAEMTQEGVMEQYNFIVDKIGHGRYMAFEIKGDSMDNDTRGSLSEGDIILARELSRDLWRDKLHIHQYPNWIIVLDNTILCKQIIAQDVENGIIKCHSLNPSPEYGDFDLNLNDVRQMFNVIQRVSVMR